MAIPATISRSDDLFVVAVLVALLFAWAVPASALPGQLNGFADLTTIQADHEEERHDTLRREANLNWNHTPFSLFTIQSGLRYFRYDIATDLEGDDWREELITHGMFNLRPSSFTLSAGVRRRDALSRSTDGDLITDNMDVMFSTRPETWPIASLRYGWQHIHDGIFTGGRDTYDRSLHAGLDWTRREYTASYGFTRRLNENMISGLDSRLSNHVLRTSYFRRQSGDDRLHLNAQYTLSHSRQTDERSGDAAVLESVPIQAGIFVEDASPDVGELEPVLGLDDGDRETATNPLIDLGGAVEDRNIGVDLGFRRLSDTIYLSLDREPGSGVLWNVWVSEDNHVWTLWDSAPLVTYNTGLGRFEISYTQAEYRYIKIVKSGLAATTSLLVTELEIFRTLPQEFEGRSRKRTVHMLSSRTGYQLAPRWHLQFDLSRRQEEAEDDYDDRSSTDYALRVLNEYSAILDQQLSWEQSFQKGAGEAKDLRGDNLRYSLRARPLEDLHGTFSAGRRWSTIDGERDQVFTSANTEVRGRPYQEITIVGSAGWSKTHQSMVGTSFSTLRAQFGAEMKMRPNLDLGLGIGRQRTKTEPSGELRNRRTWNLTSTWRPTPSLMLRGSAYLSSDIFNTESSNAVVDWRLTPKLSIGAQLTRNRSGRNSDTDRVSAHMNYRFKRQGLAYLRYSEVNFQDAGGGRTAILQQGLRISF